MGCRHYWLVVGAKGHRWLKGHALARCARCPAWTIVEYGNIGPCSHVVGRSPTIGFQCPECGQELSDDKVGECPGCHVDLKTPS